MKKRYQIDQQRAVQQFRRLATGCGRGRLWRQHLVQRVVDSPARQQRNIVDAQFAVDLPEKIVAASRLIPKRRPISGAFTPFVRSAITSSSLRLNPAMNARPWAQDRFRT
jgi:hypothetical protein